MPARRTWRGGRGPGGRCFSCQRAGAPSASAQGARSSRNDSSGSFFVQLREVLRMACPLRPRALSRASQSLAARHRIFERLAELGGGSQSLREPYGIFPRATESLNASQSLGAPLRIFGRRTEVSRVPQNISESGRILEGAAEFCGGLSKSPASQGIFRRAAEFSRAS